MRIDYFDLTGKKILVTGASSGIGKSIAEELSFKGAKLILSGRNRERLLETHQTLNNKEEHQIFAGDLNNDETLNDLIDSLPILDGVVLAAGIVKTLPIKFLSRAEINNILVSNFESPVILCQKLLKIKKVAKGASIIFISSIAGNLVADKGNGAYAASKGALNAICKVMALELAPQKIRVNCISPGMVFTPMTQNELQAVSFEQLEQNQLLYPLGYGNPVDVANAAIYLLAQSGQWVTGTSLVIDGGFTIK